METASIVITFVALIATVVFGYLQLVVPFIKKEVRWSRKFPFIESTEIPVRRQRRKRKRPRWLMPVLAAAVVIVIIVLTRVLLLQASELPRKPIAVMTFKNLTGDANYDYLSLAIPNLLITNLEQSRHFQVMTCERMHDLLKQIDKEDLELIDEETGFELCRMDDVNTIVIGSFTKAGNVFVTDVKILDVSSKKLLKTAQSKGEGVVSILKVQVDNLSREIVENFNLFERAIAATEMNIMEVTTTSMEAYNYFLKGRIEYSKNYFTEARKFLEKAIEIDSNFASAYYYLTYCYIGLGIGKYNGALEKAKALSNKVTEKERLFIEAAYADIIERDAEKCWRITMQLVRKYPKEKRAYIQLWYMYNVKRLFGNAIEMCNKAIELDPNYGEAWNLLGNSYDEIGNYTKAIECFKHYTSLSPGDADPFDSMGDIYFLMGQLDSALLQYKEALFVKPDYYISSGKIAYIYALRENYTEAMKWLDQSIAVVPSAAIRFNAYCQEIFYHFLLGDFDEAQSKIETIADSLHKSKKVYVNWINAWIYYDLGKLELCRDYLKESYALSEKSPDLRACCVFYLGLIEIREGFVDSSKARLDSLRSLLSKMGLWEWRKDYLLFLCNLLHAETLLNQDSLDKAIDIGKKTSEFKAQRALGFASETEILYINYDVVARGYLKKGDIDKAIAEYERLTDSDPNKRGRWLIHPVWHYELAKLYEEKGLKAKAIEQYEKFLDIWEDADKDLPEPHDARRRLKNLKEI